MLSAAYNLLWYPAVPIALVAAPPFGLHELRERFGRGEFPDSAGAPRIWIHAASVGEVEAIRAVANGLIEAYPGAVLVITTMTRAGRDAARRRIPGAAAWMLAPLDMPLAVRSFLRRLRPELVLVTETEIWPNYFIESSRFGARVAIVNGRMSERSHRRYMFARSLIKKALSKTSLIMVQSRVDARRYSSFDIPSNILVTGNTKIEEKPADSQEPLRAELAAFAPGRPILIAGSTAPGEEAVVAGAYKELSKKFPRLAMVIAPRHLDRVAEVEKVLQGNSLDYVKASALGPDAMPGDAAVMLLDTMGELRLLYRRAAIAFVGGTLAPGRGGQSPLEPAMLGVPVLLGPYHENQQEIASKLIAADGALIVKNARDLTQAVTRWLEDEPARARAGQMARHALLRSAGGARRALMKIQELISLG